MPLSFLPLPLRERVGPAKPKPCRRLVRGGCNFVIRYSQFLVRYSPCRETSGGCPGDHAVERPRGKGVWSRIRILSEGRNGSFKFQVASSRRCRFLAVRFPPRRRTCKRPQNNGGEAGIRTLGTLTGTYAFQAYPIGRSGTSPPGDRRGLYAGYAREHIVRRPDRQALWRSLLGSRGYGGAAPAGGPRRA